MTPIRTDLRHPRARDPLPGLIRQAYWVGAGTVVCGVFLVIREPSSIVADAGGILLVAWGLWSIIRLWRQRRAGASRQPDAAA